MVDINEESDWATVEEYLEHEEIKAYIVGNWAKMDKETRTLFIQDCKLLNESEPVGD